MQALELLNNDVGIDIPALEIRSEAMEVKPHVYNEDMFLSTSQWLM